MRNIEVRIVPVCGLDTWNGGCILICMHASRLSFPLPPHHCSVQLFETTALAEKESCLLRPGPGYNDLYDTLHVFMRYPR